MLRSSQSELANMGKSFKDMRLVHFGPFEADFTTGELRKHGIRLKLQDQPFQILKMLLTRAGQLVTREEIRENLWPDGTFVDFDNGLNAAVNRLREALGDSAENPKFVQTLPRRGYRFIGDLSDVVATGGYSRTKTQSCPASSSTVDSLAVLPLVNATGDPENEYLSDGISESLINLLSQFPNLRVIPRTSTFRYKGREADLKTIGRDLKVRTALTGKLIQRGDRLVVQTELVDVANDAQIWGGQFNRKLEDIFEVQEELARQISENLRLRLTLEDEKRLAKRPTQNREAYEMLLKAQFHINKLTPEGIRQGMAYARQAIEADPVYSEAYSYISFAYSALGVSGSLAPADAFPKAKAAALRALEIDESIAEAHGALGIVRIYYEWDWSGAEHALRRALGLNPNYAYAHSFWSDWLLIMGRHVEAITEAQIGLELDPLSGGLIFRLAQKLYYRRDYDRALEQLQKALELDPNFVWTYFFLGQVYAWKGMYEESLAACKKVTSLRGEDAGSRALHSLILAIAGKRHEAKTILNELKRHRKLGHVELVYAADTNSVLGEKDEAFELLEAAYSERVGMIFLGVKPTLDNIRSDPRFADLRRRIGLPQAPPPKPS